MNGSEDSLNLFLKGFSARDLAEPLPSFDDSTPASVIRAAMKRQHWDVVGVRRSGSMAGWLTQSDVAGGQGQSPCHPFDPATVIADLAPVNEVVQGLQTAPCLFVRTLGQVSGIIRRDDLQKPPMRMWLFGLVTITELRVTRMIDELCPHDAWQKCLSAGRLQKARDLQQDRLRRGQHPSLLKCLQMADKGQIVARDESLRQRTQFSSRREVEEFMKSLQDMRNNLAHSQDLSGDWDIICDLATNLHRVVLGPYAIEPTQSRRSVS